MQSKQKSVLFATLTLLVIFALFVGHAPTARAVDTCTSAPASPCVSIWFDTTHSPNLVDTTKAVGQQIVAEVNITGPPGQAMNAFDVTVYYDPTFLMAQRLSFTATRGDGIVSPFQGHQNFVLANDTTSFANSAELALSSVDTVNGQGMLFSVVFNVVGSTSSGPTPIFFDPTTTSVNNGADVIVHNNRDGSFANVAGFDYSVALSSASGSVLQGSSLTNAATVTVALTSGATQTVTLSSTATGPTCAAPNCPVVTFTPPSGSPTYTSTMAISTTASTPAGTYTISVKGSPSGTTPADETKTFTLTVTGVVHDVAVTSVMASPLTVNRPPDATVTVTVLAQTQGTTAESFSVTALAGTITEGTQPVTSLAAGASQTLTFTFSTSGLADSSYVISATASTVTGETNTGNNSLSDGTLVVHTNFVYGLSVTPNAASVRQGLGTTATVSATFSSGTSRSITLSTVVTGPACTAPNCPTATLGTTTGNPSFTPTLTIATTTSTPLGVYTITINGSTDDVTTRSTTFTLTVTPAFVYSLSVSPNSATVIQGSGTSATVTATLVQGTSRSVTLSTVVTGPACTAPNCPVATLGTASGTPTFTSSLSITTTASTPTGTYTVTINGSADDMSTRSTTFMLTVTAAFVYSLSVSPASATITQGNSASATVTATLAQGTSRSITLSTTVTGPTCTAPNCPVATLGTATGTPTFSSTLTVTTT